MRKSGTILIMLWSIYAPAQITYRFIPDSNCIWTSQDLSNNTVAAMFYTPPTLFDTTINSLHYSKIYVNSLSGIQGNGYLGCYRSLPDGHTFYIPKDSINEFTLMNIAAQIGDTINNVFFHDIPSLFAASVSSFKVYNVGSVIAGSFTLKTISVGDINNSNNGLFWIESIGGINGIDNQIPDGLNPWVLYCMSALDTTWYLNGNPTMLPGQTCQMDLEVPEQKENEINIFPDPFSTEINIQNIPPGSEAVLFDAMGRKIWSEATMNEIEIVSDNFPGGIYLLQVKSKDGKIICSKKMVKQ